MAHVLPSDRSRLPSSRSAFKLPRPTKALPETCSIAFSRRPMNFIPGAPMNVLVRTTDMLFFASSRCFTLGSRRKKPLGIASMRLFSSRSVSRWSIPRKLSASIAVSRLLPRFSQIIRRRFSNVPGSICATSLEPTSSLRRWCAWLKISRRRAESLLNASDISSTLPNPLNRPRGSANMPLFFKSRFFR